MSINPNYRKRVKRGTTAGQGILAATVVALFQCCVRFLILRSVLRQPMGPDRFRRKRRAY